MMIGDLLAQITGEATPKPPTPAQPPKRKATDDPSPELASKAARTMTSGLNGKDRNGAGGPTRSPTTARPKPANQTPAPPRTMSTSTPRPPSTPHPPNSASRPYTSARPLGHNRPNTTSNGNGTKPVAAAFAAAAATTPATSQKPAPKKGSYLEIMERAKAAQATMSQRGRIQHKPMEKLPTKREQMLAKAATTSRPGAMMKKGPPGMRPPGSGRGRSSPATNGSGRQGSTERDHQPVGSKGAGANGTAAGNVPVLGAARRRPKAAKEEEKRPKKAATATTGYQGTARPRPTSSSSATGAGASNGASRGGSGLSRGALRMPFGHPRRSRYDDEDDEMDDFIEYDDEEVEQAAVGGRYAGYDDEDEDEEEDESDMEAGISDIDDEEQRAERLARREDAEQEALERRLKAEKEERKRRLMAGASRR